MIELYDYQLAALKQMSNGCILNGGVGSGKSRTGLAYYYLLQGGSLDGSGLKPSKKWHKLYIITTARKRDTQEWEAECEVYGLNSVAGLITVDSWNNIKKYTDIKGAFIIFDEDRVTGNGVWVKSFLKMAQTNSWIILSATPGDTWSDYIPVFIANGFYKNRSDFNRQHVIFSKWCKFPKIEKYISTGKLILLRRRILVNMDFHRPTIPHKMDIVCEYDANAYRRLFKDRWDDEKDCPIESAAKLCYELRKCVNGASGRLQKVLEIAAERRKAIIFYNYDYELERLLDAFKSCGRSGLKVAQWNGHVHEALPNGDDWVYLVNYAAGAEGWNCITTDTIIFYSQNYSYKTMVQAAGRIDRVNTPFKDLYFYHLKSRAPIDLAIGQALVKKKKFNESDYIGHLEKRGGVMGEK